MKTYEVLCSINSGKHKAGDCVNFSDKDAVALLKAGAIRAMPCPLPLPENATADAPSSQAKKRRGK